MGHLFGTAGDDALQVIEKLLRSDEGPELMVQRAELLRAQGRNAEALEAFDKLIHRYPGDIVALEGRGLVLLEQKRYDEALDQFDRAISIEPQAKSVLLFVFFR